MSTELNGDARKPRSEDMPRLVPVESSALVREMRRLRTENVQLMHALESRVVIEQAKGVLAERYGLSMLASFELLRHAARSNRMKIHTLANKVVSTSETPPEFGHVRPPQSPARAR